MDVREKLGADMKSAMKERDQVRLDAIRFLISAVRNLEIELRPRPITPDEVLGVLKKLAKQRKESIEQYKAGKRQDLVDKETRELAIIESYLPAQLGREQLEKLVADVVAELKATSLKDMGAVMKAAQAKAGGAADGRLLSELVKAKLQ